MTEEELQHMEDVVRHPSVWLETYGKILMKDGISPQNFTPNYIQLRILAAVEYFLENDLRLKMIVLKPRQSGGSTIIAGLNYWFMRVRGGTSLAMAHTQKVMTYHFEIFKTYHKHDTFKWNNEMKFKESDGMVTCSHGSRRYRDSAEASSPGVGGTFHFAHISESSKFPVGGVRDANKYVPQMRAAISKEPGCMYIEESTPEGIGNLFAKAYRGDGDAENPLLRQGAVTLEDFKKGETGNGYIKVWAPWFRFDDYTRKLTGQAEYEEIARTLSVNEKNLIKMFGSNTITAQRLKWRREEIANFGGNENLFIQEYTEDEEKAFLLSGSPIFDGETLVRLAKMVKASPPPRTVKLHRPEDMQAKKMARHDGGVPVYAPKDRKVSVSTVANPTFSDMNRVAQIYEEPINGCEYLVVVDCMEGIELVKNTNKRDLNSILVLRRRYQDDAGVWHRKGLVARSHPQNQADPTPGADLAARLADYYGGAKIAIEVASAGAAWITRLKDMGATLYQREEYDEISQKFTPKLGWKTTEGTRRDAVDGLVLAFHQNDLWIPCENVRKQAYTFVRDEKGKPVAEAGNHDDDIMALAIGNHLLDEHAVRYRPLKNSRISY